MGSVAVLIARALLPDFAFFCYFEEMNWSKFTGSTF